jgi:hypothetical protein
MNNLPVTGDSTPGGSANGVPARMDEIPGYFLPTEFNQGRPSGKFCRKQLAARQFFPGRNSSFADVRRSNLFFRYTAGGPLPEIDRNEMLLGEERGLPHVRGPRTASACPPPRNI